MGRYLPKLPTSTSTCRMRSPPIASSAGGGGGGGGRPRAPRRDATRTTSHAHMRPGARPTAAAPRHRGEFAELGSISTTTYPIPRKLPGKRSESRAALVLWHFDPPPVEIAYILFAEPRRLGAVLSEPTAPPDPLTSCERCGLICVGPSPHVLAPLGIHIPRKHCAKFSHLVRDRSCSSPPVP